jgi:CheY-like chemotaxis protein
MKIILVEDNMLTARAEAELLRLDGTDEVIELHSGNALLEELATADPPPPPDCLVVDYYLPYQTGVDVFRKARKAPGWGGVPVVLVTAGDAAAVRGQLTPADEPVLVLPKPYTHEDLWDAVCGVANRAAAGPDKC